MDRDMERDKKTMQQECRNRDMRNRESITEPSDQVLIRTVDPTPFRGIGDRDLESRDVYLQTHEM
jgi:hypothetical protein